MNVGNMSVNKNSHSRLKRVYVVKYTIKYSLQHCATRICKDLLTSKCEENSSPYPYPLFKNASHVLDKRTIRIVDAVHIQSKRCR